MQIDLSRRAPGVLSLLAVVAVAGAVLVGVASGDTQTAAATPQPTQGSFVTIFKSTLSLEGLTADGDGNLYSIGRGGDPCPVWRVPASGGAAALVGNVPAPCSPSGVAFDAAGRLYAADEDQVLVLTPDAASPPAARVFASGVPGANGIAFDGRGDLWVSDGTASQGRVWRVGRDGVPTEVFRIQPLANDVNLVAGVGGVGRDVRSLPPGTITITPTSRAAANTAGSQHLVANGLAFTRDGALIVADTARGALWSVELDRRGALRSPIGCDPTFSENTLCLDNLLVQHPYLEGVDGIALDQAGNVWAAANERNAIVVATPRGRVVEFFRNAPDATTRLRNQGPLEFPTSPFLVDRTLCVAQSDGGRRDNAPNSSGEVGPAGPERAKIGCLDRPLDVPGVPLPVR
jgi:sugar lactone lactonase YvrE